MLSVKRVETAEVEDYLPFAWSHLQAALAHSNDEGSIDDLCEELERGELELWLIYNSGQKKLCGAATTGFLTYPMKMVLEIRTLAVDAPREEWKPLIDVLETYAAIHGCESIDLMGRRGWAKLGAQLGFKEVHVKMSRRVG